jgi:RNA polymerase sigma-70 factor (ECF subfamily)
MNSYPTDAELLARSVTEPALFGELYERHGLAVWRYVVRRIGGVAGEDLAADVFVRAFRARGRYRADRDT